MAKILPHTERFILIFNRLKAEKKLPNNAVLAKEIGLNSGNSLTEIAGRRQNIGLEVLQKFCDLYGEDNGFTYNEIAATQPFAQDDPLNWERAAIKSLTWSLAKAFSEIAALKGKKRPVEEFVQDIEQNTNLILSDLRKSAKK